MRAAYLVAARRTAVAPRGGAFKAVEADELGAAPIRTVLADTGIAAEAIDDVIFGNALHGGGNPARLAALRAGLPDHVPALTIDSQCCGGLDAIMLAAERIASESADAVIAGGVESFSRAPLRARRPRHADEAPQPYDRPPFAPWPERDPDMIAAAATLAKRFGISRARQDEFAIASHRKALQNPPAAAEITPLAGLSQDAFPRALTGATCTRLVPLAGDTAFGVTRATVAVEADAAAALLVVSETMARRLSARRPLRIISATRRGGDPAMPGAAPIAAAKSLLAAQRIAPTQIAVAEVMEAFAAQAIACLDGIGVQESALNRGGGGLARGHPIGASGAILLVRLWHEMQSESSGAIGLTTIAAAGGLGSALLATI
ncbi:acetyl-CoA C-acyltransferase [Bradyrhizobium genosp. SA-3]|uniref:thiolase family protein n=1 Tax=Bradyrhizobium genosp. SA-3 TaxID=508868 RepID=UPI0010293A86|nr:thiolase family protein [Bradyrhizobium genosp. SA-3]RZN09512.1 acetyl-CoA C-acyltransferase [Bradyrhizobium genosp. SA-3]